LQCILTGVLGRRERTGSDEDASTSEALMRTYPRTGLLLAGSATLFALAGVPTAGSVAGAGQPRSPMAVYEVLNSPIMGIEGSFKVPRYTCAAPDDAVDIYAAALDQDAGSGGAFNGAYVSLGCTAADKPKVTALLEIDGASASPSMKIDPGDSMDLDVGCGADGSEVGLGDSTTGSSGHDSSEVVSACSDTYIGNIGIPNGAGRYDPLPTFKRISFSGVSIDNHQFASWNPVPVNYFEGRKNQIVVDLQSGPNSWSNAEKP
jgi:hypothetical protein